MIIKPLSEIKPLTLLLAICICLWACENDVNEVRELSKKKPSIEEGRNIDSYLSMNGKVNARLTAPVLIRYQGDSARKSEFPKSLHVDFYNDSMKIESQLSAKYGRYMEDENKVFLRDSVVAFNIKGDTMFCNELYWDKITGRFYTDKKVILSLGFRSSVFIALNGMNCSQDLTDRTLFNMRSDSYTTIADSTTAAKPVSPPTPPVAAKPPK
jgi:LPS export ABC transporter protein LptC